MSKTKRIKFTVDRARWVNGSTSDHMGNSALLNEEGNMCCVGFLALACGLTEKQINLEPAFICVSQSAQRGRKRVIDAVEESDVYVTNDDHGNARSRERKLTRLFRKIGVDVKFTGRAPRRPKEV